MPENSKLKYLITTHENLDIHCNLFDQSCVEYARDCTKGNFEIKFDEKLYEPPEQILRLEKLLQSQEKEK